jgi:hypothetical protein
MANTSGASGKRRMESPQGREKFNDGTGKRPVRVKGRKVSIITTRTNIGFQIEYFLVIVIILSRESDGF